MSTLFPYHSLPFLNQQKSRITFSEMKDCWLVHCEFALVQKVHIIESQWQPAKQIVMSLVFIRKQDMRDILLTNKNFLDMYLLGFISPFFINAATQIRTMYISGFLLTTSELQSH